jgi:EmrB/QacA subfamily drug resistance transporter
MSLTPSEQRARELHPAGSARRIEVVDAAGVDEVGVAPWPILLRERLVHRAGDRHRWLVLVVVLAGLFTTSITITLLAVSLVDIADDLGTTETTLAWVITGPMLVFGLVGPALGKAGDLYGHKRLFLIGLAGAAIFAVATAFAWSPLTLIVFRTLSAGFGSATAPAAMATINRLFEADERVKALGWWSFVTAGAPVLGVVMGGPLVEAVGWRVIFLVQAPLCVTAMAVAAVLMPETRGESRGAFDWKGAILLGAGITSLLLATNRGGEWGWTSPGVVGLYLAVPLAVVGFVAVERRAEEPLLPMRWLHERNITAPMASQCFANFAYMGGFILTPVLLQEGLGYTATAVGLLIIFRPLTFSLTAPLAGFVTVRVGERVAGIAGSLIVLLSMLLLAALDEGSSWGIIALALALSGMGLGVSAPAMTATVANAVDDDDLGVAGALQQLVVQVGAVIGIQVMQTVQGAAVDGQGLVGSYRVAYLVGAAVCTLAVATAAFVQPTQSEALAPVSA